MAQLSYINTGVNQTPDLTLNIPTDESVGAFLFDTSGFDKPFDGFPLLYHNFKDGQIQCIKNMDDALLLGIKNDGFLNNLLYYHLAQFFDFIGDNQAVYVTIADCSKDWDVLQYMQQQTSGRIFHIGVWTSQPVWNKKSDGTMGFTSLITDLQTQANEINGRIGVSTHTMVPLHIVLCGNTNYIGGDQIRYKQLPNAIELNCPKVSIALVQNGSQEVHQMQSNNPLQAPVTSLGLIMACLALCGAEESIASIEKCDLNKNEGFNNPEWGVGSTGTPMDSVHRVWANTISSKGYIIPIDYEGLEASYFLSSDQTLCEGDFSTIANNRIMHKCRRAMCMALIPYVNSNHIYIPGTHNISATSIAIITDSINTILDSVMRNKQGQNQINGRVVTFLENDEILENDSISMKLEIGPVNYSGFLSEEVSHDIN